MIPVYGSSHLLKPNDRRNFLTIRSVTRRREFFRATKLVARQTALSGAQFSMGATQCLCYQRDHPGERTWKTLKLFG